MAAIVTSPTNATHRPATPPVVSSSQMTPAGRWQALAVLAVAMVLAMATWFSTTVVLDQLAMAFTLDEAATRLVAIAVQLGFVAGAVVSALLGIADRLPPRRLAAGAAVLTAMVNATALVAPNAWALVIGRFGVGASLALVCPPLLAAMSGWFDRQRGLALGVMIGALTLGSAMPHLVRGVGVPDWRTVVLASSVCALGAGVAARWAVGDGPLGVPAARFDAHRIVALVARPGVRHAYVGYLGHMWELYAAWTWVGLFLQQALEGDARVASLATFGVVAIGAVGSVAGGVMGERVGKARTAKAALVASGAIASVLGFVGHWPRPLVVGLALAWGFVVIADSAQFSALVTDHAPSDLIGTALTVQLASGFALTAVTMWLVPVVEASFGWGPALAVLAPGPAVGALAMQRLERYETRTTTAEGRDPGARLAPPTSEGVIATEDGVVVLDDTAFVHTEPLG